MVEDPVSTLVAMTRGLATLSGLHAHDPDRHRWLTLDACGLHADFSRNLVSKEMFDASMRLVERCRVPERFGEMFDGRAINVTEERGVSHVACRGSGSATDRIEASAQERRRARAHAELIRSEPTITSVINIGIGGSDLGPRMAIEALRAHRDGPEVHFVSNVDPADLDEVLSICRPASTVVVVSSKTFTTLETMSNAERARRWMLDAGVDWSERFYGSTASPEVAIEWGIDPDRCFRFHDWVGGRFSISSVIGFPVMIAIGPDAFDGFLAGMRDMDTHVTDTPAADNLAVVHGVIWYLNSVVHGHDTVAVVPYGHDLAGLVPYLQQLTMESNGKRVGLDGVATVRPTAPIVWGHVGTDGQHAFFQLLHQGTRVAPVEFISTVAPMGSDRHAHEVLVANMIAQSEALAVGRKGVSTHRDFPGNRPSTVIMMDRLDPGHLGSLVAMYEHSTAVQGWLMGVNSFDQFGVELGKEMATDVVEKFASSAIESDGSLTHPLMEWFIKNRSDR